MGEFWQHRMAERFARPVWTVKMAMPEKITTVHLCDIGPPAILRSLLSRDLFDVSPAEAHRMVLEAVDGCSRARDRAAG